MSFSLIPYIKYPKHMFYVVFKKFSVVNNFYELQTKLSIVTRILIHTEKAVLVISVLRHASCTY